MTDKTWKHKLVWARLPDLCLSRAYHMLWLMFWMGLYVSCHTHMKKNINFHISNTLTWKCGRKNIKTYKIAEHNIIYEGKCCSSNRRGAYLKSLLLFKIDWYPKKFQHDIFLYLLALDKRFFSNKTTTTRRLHHIFIAWYVPFNPIKQTKWNKKKDSWRRKIRKLMS